MIYQIITQEGINTKEATSLLQIKVNQELRNGWEVVGGVSTCNESTQIKKIIVASQAMQKDE